MFMYKSLCIYVCLYISVYISQYTEILIEYDKIADIDNSISAISKKVTDIE